MGWLEQWKKVLISLSNMTTTFKQKLVAGIALCVGILFSAVLLLNNQAAYGNVTQQDPAPTGHRLDHYQFFATTSPQVTFATTTLITATSTSITSWLDSAGRRDNGYFVVAGAEAATLYFSRSAGLGSNNGSTVFDFQVSDDGTNWYDYDKILMTNTGATTTPTYTISAATTTTVVNVDLREKAFYAIRCIILNVTDGAASCKATARY